MRAPTLDQACLAGQRVTALLSLAMAELQPAKKSRDPEATLRKGVWLHSITFGTITLRVNSLSLSSQNGKVSQPAKINMLPITLSQTMQLPQAVFSQVRLMMSVSNTLEYQNSKW